MPAVFQESGVQFQYPENWDLNRDEIDHGWIVELQSPATAFMLLCLRTDLPMPSELLDQSVADLRADYPELEVDLAAGRVAGHDATGYDVRFFSLDFTNTCVLRSFKSRVGTLLLLTQFTDLDAEVFDPTLQAIVASIRIDS